MLVLALTGDTGAGMPSPLPSDFKTVSRLTDSAHARVQAISFFVVMLLVSALLVQVLWNGVRRDFPRLPRLRFPAALAAVVLWGLMFVVVLTMISGARELMTPGAWEKQGFTYKLAGSKPSAVDADAPDVRAERLEGLAVALMRFAAKNGGRFPEKFEDAAAGEVGEVPGFAGLRYVYVPGLTVDDPGRVLLYEPEVDRRRRLVLTAGGNVRAMNSEELAKALARGAGR